MTPARGHMQRRATLRSAERELLEAARTARSHAYAPYSGFAVGAAVRSGSGHIYAACNVENASFGLTVCAERNAVAAAVAAGETELQSLLILTDMSPPAPPCGACRQVLAEMAPDLAIMLANESGGVERVRLGRLLPRQFDGGALTRRR